MGCEHRVGDIVICNDANVTHRILSERCIYKITSALEQFVKVNELDYWFLSSRFTRWPVLDTPLGKVIYPK